MSNSGHLHAGLAKAPTGIEGFDEITGGGLPRGRTTLLLGGAGSGKSVFALQTLVNGAKRHGEPGIFVAFEENSRRIVANAASFGWELEALQRRRLFFLDAQPSPDLVMAGGFDLQALLAAVGAKAKAMGAKRVVFDSVDVLLSLLADPAAAQREVHRLHHWLLEQDLTAIITSRVRENPTPDEDTSDYMQFMVDCAVRLNHDVVASVSHRNLRVVKYRGTGFAENESPMVIGKAGVEVAGSHTLDGSFRVTTERVSTGIARLDSMLDGGYYRASCVLITGSPGTAKSTLCGTFAEAACNRGERVLFVSFDSEAEEIVRNLASVRIRLGRYKRSGLLRMYSSRSTTCSAEVHLLNIKALAAESRTRCLVIDPISALAKAGMKSATHSVAERLIDWAKSQDMTVLSTSLLSDADPQGEGTPMQISTIADAWIHLSYVINAGERNRALTIIKSRGTAHSNQVRELILSNRGVTLADVYTSGGQVLTGTMRWQKERDEKMMQDRARSEVKRKRIEIELAQADLQNRVAALRSDLALKQEELELMLREEATYLDAARRIGNLRGDDGKASRRGRDKAEGGGK